MFSRKSTSILALDLAPDAVRAVEVVMRKDYPLVTAVATETLPPGNSDSLPQRHLTALQSLISTHHLRSRHCLATLPTNLVITRSVAIDASKASSVQEQIRLALQNSNSRDSRDLMFDFWTVSAASAKNRAQQVLVVATQASVVHRYLNGFKKLGLTCDHMDVSPCALSSLVAQLAPSPETMIGTVVLCENVGYFAVVERQNVLFWRPFELSSGPGRTGSVVQAGLERIGDEVSKCVSHMVGSNDLDAMSELFVFGHGADDSAFTSYLFNRFSLPVRTPSPFDSLPQDAISEDLRAKLEPAIASHYATAMGLTLQTSGGANHG
jgi:Tfp pilus assembly PilM family ATPase